VSRVVSTSICLGREWVRMALFLIIDPLSTFSNQVNEIERLI
jgi:hypothetical protein